MGDHTALWQQHGCEARRVAGEALAGSRGLFIPLLLFVHGRWRTISAIGTAAAGRHLMQLYPAGTEQLGDLQWGCTFSAQ